MAEVIEMYQGIPSDWVYHRGDIYIANLNPYIGAEQGGIRPVVVLQNNILCYCPYCCKDKIFIKFFRCS